MPVIRDKDGTLYAIPLTELQKYKVTPEELKAMDVISGRDPDDIEMEAGGPAWYSGD
jgi:hypothetical protein